MKPFAWSVYCGLAVSGLASTLAVAAEQQPKLVLQITVDQLRGDFLDRNRQHFGDGGFRYLLDSGTVFTNAHHRHANTETIVGHVTLATGTDPAIHGMVANLWFDRKEGAPHYNVQDARYPLVGEGGVDQSTELDPTQRAATTDGRSPSAILTSTLADEISIGISNGSKVFGVSVKDRGAISMAGHTGTAYWFSKSDASFISSTYYMDDYPAWVREWNAAGHVSAYAGTSWTLADSGESYRFADADDMEWETDFPGFGRAFPHPYGEAEGDRFFTTRLTLGPAGDVLTAEFAKALIDAEDIGSDAVTDYLSVSFSSTDYVGHIFGPSSLETEDNLRHLDRTLAGLLAHVDEKVGLDNTLIVLSADHGAAEVPGYLRSIGIDAHYFDFEAADKGPAIAALKSEFGIAEELIESFSNPYVYLDRDVIAQRGLDFDRVARRVASELADMPGIAFAVSSADLRAGAVASTSISEAVLANFHASRSGDIYIVFEPHWFIGDMDGLTVAGAHGSPWSYDTHVPIILAGPGITAQRVYRRVETVDLAPTVAAYLRIKAPSGTRGRILTEALPQP
ncbi:alkaline phosphatase family protein [Roseibium sp.]|uniref:alkaline phosphatase family protein n=1 Tax=Roseibium sp. TaxID=1936156 RepID=UPI003A97EE60